MTTYETIVGERMTSIAVEPTFEQIMGARWHCAACDVEQPLDSSARSAAEYAGWCTIWPTPACPTCHSPMAIVVREITRIKHVEPVTKPLTRAELRAKRELRKHVEENPEDALFPLPGEHVGKRMRDVPRHELVRARSYYTAKKRRGRERSRELVVSIDAALALIDAAPITEFPHALRDKPEDKMPWEKN